MLDYIDLVERGRIATFHAMHREPADETPQGVLDEYGHELRDELAQWIDDRGHAQPPESQPGDGAAPAGEPAGTGPTVDEA